MLNRKSSGHDGLTKEFYEYFWDDLKFYSINSLKQSKIDGNLSISQIHKIGTKDSSKTGDQFLYLILPQKYFLNHLQKNLRMFSLN